MRNCFVVAGLLVLATGLGCRQESKPAGTPGGASTVAAASATVELVVDFGDGAQKHIGHFPHAAGMTVTDMMKDASAGPDGLKFEQRGFGEGAFVTSIDGVENEGGGAEARNWMFRVNDEPSDVGMGAYVLQPSDKVLWRYMIYEGSN